MDGRELTMVLTKDPKMKPYFRGVYSFDTLFTDSECYINRNEKNILVFNASKSSSIGTHWLGILFGFIGGRGENSSSSFFIDSFCRDPSYYSHSTATTIDNSIDVASASASAIEEDEEELDHMPTMTTMSLDNDNEGDLQKYLATFMPLPERLYTLPYRVQPFTSNTCGLYVTYFLRKLIETPSMERAMIPFVKDMRNLSTNDQIVTDWFKRTYSSL